MFVTRQFMCMKLTVHRTPPVAVIAHFQNKAQEQKQMHVPGVWGYKPGSHPSVTDIRQSALYIDGTEYHQHNAKCMMHKFIPWVGHPVSAIASSIDVYISNRNPRSWEGGC